ncbi:tetratricopeptide repeat protein 1 isoform X2 [Iris pallida]|uniref:Tetratricopeptide repeat protein 1 isoform X2 n=1 Tax=Iris pallida TaxID=29817 RepID=A0AAX6E3B7_IRIPA|nr:tetratricopeptide repeat protein 1 isoform X2 [Iris pallida]
MVVIEPEPEEVKESPSPEEEEGEDSFEDALTQDQLHQRALNQANDAKAEGNKLFGAGKYDEALLQYELALQIAPEVPSSEEVRSMCHANRAVCFLKVGRYDDAIKECTKALELKPSYVKALLRRGEAQEKLDHYEEAISDMKKIIEIDPSNDQARRTIMRLEPLAAEKREKMKEEMIDQENHPHPFFLHPLKGKKRSREVEGDGELSVGTFWNERR